MTEKAISPQYTKQFSFIDSSMRLLSLPKDFQCLVYFFFGKFKLLVLCMLFVNTLKWICRILSFISSCSCSYYKSAQYRQTECNAITWYNATTRYKRRLGTLQNDYCSYQTYKSFAFGLIRLIILALVLPDLSKSCCQSYQTNQSLATGLIRLIKVLPLVLSYLSVIPLVLSDLS